MIRVIARPTDCSRAGTEGFPGEAGHEPRALDFRATAYPNGAPWYAWEDGGCAQCHWNNPIVRGSAKLDIEGLPDQIEPGKRYPLTQSFDAAETKTANLGFFFTVLGGEEVSGELISESPALQAQGGQARSRCADPNADKADKARWSVTWQAPDSPSAEHIRFILWLNEADGDASQMGDIVDKCTFEVCVD